MENRSCVIDFMLAAFPMTLVMRALFFSFLLIIHIVTLSGNFLILLTVWKSHSLHTPMYYFLVNLSILDICFTSSIIPKFLTILASENRSISFQGCLTQCYFYFLLGSVELLLLAVMAFDRYTAVCHPLRYTTVMTSDFCLYLTVGCWLAGFADTIIPTFLIINLCFCGSNVIDHFFCDAEHLLKLACYDTRIIHIVNICCSFVIVFGSLVCIMISYGCIILAIIKTSKVGRRWKSSSTCVSHLLVVVIIYGSSLFLCMRGITLAAIDISKLSAFMTGIVTPLLSPFI
ncbi:PREDICTED: olfactory receptor 6J1-like [Nanorana parkeri]|uniref:olfactory receptor 6J1-like n=1 Tax=Nanorana parkeri TaxID=125878 RepID=UPI000854D02F|nr:PREDICTED: olfactory receptor 6J1-like [Nanorana parkeri]